MKKRVCVRVCVCVRVRRIHKASQQYVYCGHNQVLVSYPYFGAPEVWKFEIQYCNPKLYNNNRNEGEQLV